MQSKSPGKEFGQTSPKRFYLTTRLKKQNSYNLLKANISSQHIELPPTKNPLIKLKQQASQELKIVRFPTEDSLTEDNTMIKSMMQLQRIYQPIGKRSPSQSLKFQRRKPMQDPLHIVLERVRVVLDHYSQREAEYKRREEAMLKEISSLKNRLQQYEGKH